MTKEDLLNKGYFPKELPPCFFTELLGNNYSNISNDLINNETASLTALLNTVNLKHNLNRTQKDEEKTRLKQIFKNSLAFSDSVQFSIPKAGLARNILKIPNPLHQGKLSESIATNYSAISSLFADSTLSTTKPSIETEVGEGKRSVFHNNYSYYKELCIINSFKYAIQLRTDISKFYPSIYTHTIPWVTFGGKDIYKRNRVLHQTDPLKVTNIYGDDLDNKLMWCQNQQTMGIPIGPDTSFIVAEIIGCHIDKLIDKSLKKKKIDFIGYRYYDDYTFYFNTELDAQIGLAELKNILNEFELKINDKKTSIGKTQNELEKDWALAIKSFYFRPSDKDQKEDIWNFFSLAFKYAATYPEDSILKLALNKFNFVRIEKENWSFFESLIFRLGLVETAALQKIAKLLVTYKSLVDKQKLKDFCFEIVLRHYENRYDYELSWALWILNEFDIQPTKELFENIFQSQSICASLIALDLLNKNRRIKSFDFSVVISSMTTESLNTKTWLLTYETVYKGWITSLSNSIITDHFYFNILKSRNIYFYDSNRKLEPLKTDHSYFKKIEKKIDQLNIYLTNNKIEDEELKQQIEELSQTLDIATLSQKSSRKEIQTRLTKSDSAIKKILLKIEEIKGELKMFEKKKPYFVIGKRLEELGVLTTKEIDSETRHDKNLLFDPEYD